MKRTIVFIERGDDKVALPSETGSFLYVSLHLVSVNKWGWVKRRRKAYSWTAINLDPKSYPLYGSIYPDSLLKGKSTTKRSSVMTSVS